MSTSASASTASSYPSVSATGSSMWSRLVEFERELDHRIAKKQTQIADASFKVFKVKRTLKITVSHVPENQQQSLHAQVRPEGGAVQDAPPAPMIPGWTLRIEGRLDGSTTSSQGRSSSRVPLPKPFSHFVRSLVVQLDSASAGDTVENDVGAVVGDVDDDDDESGGQKDDHFDSVNVQAAARSSGAVTGENCVADIVEWVKGPGTPDTDGFEIRRTGRTAVVAKIIMRLDDQPERFTPSKELQVVLPTTPGSLVTKPAAVLAIWQYVKVHKLQESDEKKLVKCDDTLQAIFGKEQLSFSDIPHRLEPHLLPAEPIVLKYPINLGAAGSLTWCYEVDVDDTSRSVVRPTAGTIVAHQREIGLLEHRIHEMGNMLRASAIHERLLRQFANDPVGSLHRLLEAQCADQEITIGAGGGGDAITVDDLDRSSNFDTEEMERAIRLFCNGPLGKQLFSSSST
jgi:SWI/SNF-related matrix-associated actin-dependent regulator of chromatin subfamily D